MSNLIEALKKEIGYTEGPMTICRNCLFSVETANSQVDRLWDWTCKRNIDVPLPIEPNGRCDRFEA